MDKGSEATSLGGWCQGQEWEAGRDQRRWLLGKEVPGMCQIFTGKESSAGPSGGSSFVLWEQKTFGSVRPRCGVPAGGVVMVAGAYSGQFAGSLCPALNVSF